VLSFFLSAVIPGSGQYYNGTPGEITKGVVQEVGIIGPLIFNRFNYDDRGADFAELFMICGSYLWSIIDAPLSSADINRELARRKQAISPFNTRLTLLTDSAFHLVPGAEISLRF
jgi:hypothetical protein